MNKIEQAKKAIKTARRLNKDDPISASYALRDIEIVKENESLYDLLWDMASNEFVVSRGDVEGVIEDIENLIKNAR